MKSSYENGSYHNFDERVLKKIPLAFFIWVNHGFVSATVEVCVPR